jgi:AraC family transcriptional regulator, exoenzyme S synthesis regulatory protein ExsA
VVNLYDKVLAHPTYYRQLNCGECLITMYNCPLEKSHQDLWSRHSYIVYVVMGRKVWHTPGGSYDLHEGQCALVRKGAAIVEQFLDVPMCVVLFFVPDEFICEVLATKTNPLRALPQKFDPVICIEPTPSLRGFFHSMMPYFEAGRLPDKSLLHLKFRELILTIADNPSNAQILSYFCSLMNAPRSVSLQRVMEDNFSYNLKLEEFARLSSRSLSAFKRDFIKCFNMPPGRWLLEKRLDHALHLLTNLGRTVNEAAFESGFESASHFSRVFRDRFGRSPAAVKQQTMAVPIRDAEVAD